MRTHGRPPALPSAIGIASAAVLGLGPAIIAVSPATCARLTDEELDQVILHEWAHVQRRDDFSRLAQMACTVVAGLHPAVWWIGRRLEIERETACDDFAVNITGAARSLARCLTKLAESREARRPAVLVPGVLASSQLATRVQRLLDPSRNRSTARARGVLGPIAAALVALAASLSQVELVAAAGPPPVPPPVHAPQVGLPRMTAPLPSELPEAAGPVSSPPLSRSRHLHPLVPHRRVSVSRAPLAAMRHRPVLPPRADCRRAAGASGAQLLGSAVSAFRHGGRRVERGGGRIACRGRADPVGGRGGGRDLDRSRFAESRQRHR